MKHNRVIFESENKEYRILEYVDECADMENLKGDSYSPKVNTDIDADQLASEERAFEQLVNREGVFGYVLERWDPTPGAGYEHVDSCWGFVGTYDPNLELFNHYIVDELKSLISSNAGKARA